MRNFTILICGLLIAGTFVGFATNKTILKKNMAHNEKVMLNITNDHAITQFGLAKEIINNDKSDSEALGLAIFYLSEAAMHTNSKVTAQVSNVLQVAVDKLKTKDENYNMKVYKNYIDNVKVFVETFDFEQPTVVLNNVNYPYLTKNTAKNISKLVPLGAHVIELETPQGEKTWLYLDGGDYQHYEASNQNNHTH